MYRVFVWLCFSWNNRGGNHHKFARAHPAVFFSLPLGSRFVERQLQQVKHMRIITHQSLHLNQVSPVIHHQIVLSFVWHLLFCSAFRSLCSHSLLWVSVFYQLVFIYFKSSDFRNSYSLALQVATCSGPVPSRHTLVPHLLTLKTFCPTVCVLHWILLLAKTLTEITQNGILLRPRTCPTRRPVIVAQDIFLFILP